MSRFTISVYQRKIAGQLVWSTLGLGPLNQEHRGKSATKLQRHLADRLRAQIKQRSPAEVARMELVRGRRLRRHHLELAVRTEHKRIKVSGLIPFIVEPHRRTPTERISIAYHPLRQDIWMLVDPEVALPDQLRRFFSRVLAGTPEHELQNLRTDGKDVLRAFSFSERGPRLIDELPDPDADVFADLDPTPRKERKRTRRRKRRFGRKQLRAIAENITTRVADELVPWGKPREPWRGQLAQLLNGPRKTPTVLIGPAGVGKTTLLHRWVKDLLDADDYASHRNLDQVHEVWRLSARRILAGMSHVGEWEKRVVELASEAADPRVVLWIEDLHTFGRAGRTRDSDRTLADVLRGPLQRSEMTLVGEATEAQWHRLQEDAPAFADRFTVLYVTPTGPRETAQLLLHEARILEPRHRIRFGADAYRTILALGSVLHPGSAEPGVAIDLARRIARQAGMATEAETPTPIGADQTLTYLAERTGLPEALLQPDAPLSVEATRDSFAAHVLGQPEAVRAAVDLVCRIRAGLTDPTRPFATYLFTGPTGTGKTQMAKSLARYLYGYSASRLVRVDMGEMSGPDAVARLIGHRWDPRGLLTDAIREQPFSVVLLDEIEKAHPSVLQLLLQLLDEGRLTDAAGDTADFTKSVVVMTSNLGARPRAALGFGERADGVLQDVARAVREFFPPELFNRIDRVVPFRPLTPEVAELVTEKELAELLARRGLTDRKVFVFAQPEAIRRMASQAFDDRGGARSVKRYLEAHVGRLLSDELARASAATMRVVRVHGGGSGGYRLHVSALTEADPLDVRFELEGLVDASTRSLRARLPELHQRVEAIRKNPAMDRVRSRRTELLDDNSPEAQSALYFLDRFLEELDRLHTQLEDQTRSLADVERELEVDRRRPAKPQRWGHRHNLVPTGTHRFLRREALVPIGMPMSRDQILTAFGEVALLEGALDRLHEPAEHRVVVELLRVGQGRRPPSFEAESHGLLEWLARVYADIGATVQGAAARTADGSIHELPWDELLAHRPLMLVFELDGVAIRALLEGEEGCHVWASLLHGSEIVRMRLVPAASPRAWLNTHAERMAAFGDALDQNDAELPADPEGLMPAIRHVRYDPPARPGETSLLEVEDYVTGQVVAEQTRSFEPIIRSLVWLRSSARPQEEAT